MRGMTQTSLLISALSLFGALSSSVPAFVSASLGTPLPVPYPASFLLPIASVLSDVFAHSAPLTEAGDNAEATQLHEVALFALDSLIWEPSEIDLEGWVPLFFPTIWSRSDEAHRLESLLREPTLFSRITDPRAPLPNITAAVRVLTQLAGRAFPSARISGFHG